jgi:hypothetical protein
MQGGLSVLEFYHGSLKAALSGLFPEIKIGDNVLKTINQGMPISGIVYYFE